MRSDLLESENNRTSWRASEGTNWSKRHAQPRIAVHGSLSLPRRKKLQKRKLQDNEKLRQKSQRRWKAATAKQNLGRRRVEGEGESENDGPSLKGGSERKKRDTAHKITIVKFPTLPR